MYATTFCFHDEYLDYSFQKKSRLSQFEIFYKELKPGLSRYRKRSSGWLTVLVTSFVILGMGALIVNADYPSFLNYYGIVSVLVTLSAAAYSFISDLEDFWFVDTYTEKRVLILNDINSKKIISLLKDRTDNTGYVFSPSDNKETPQTIQ